MEEASKRFDKVFKILSFILMVVFTLTISISPMIGKISYDKQQLLISTYGESSEIVKNYKFIEPLSLTYNIQNVLCVISIILFIIYFAQKIFVFKDFKINKSILFKNWPVLVLIVFLILLSVGSIQATMEVNAEVKVRSASNVDELPKSVVDIANWTSR